MANFMTAVATRVIRRAWSAVLFAAMTVCLAGVPGAAIAAGDPQDGTGPEERSRIAFVLGNNTYGTLKPLKNAVNDGKLIAAGLKRLNFNVVEGYDLTLAEMQELFKANRPLIDKSDAVVFYFAGHGFQLGGTNYLVPVDATLTSVADIPSQAVTLNAVIAELESANRPLLIFLDACRENPLPPSADGPNLDGLAQIDAGLNTFIAFSTEPGNVSNGGTGVNSPFAQALAMNIETPGLSISDLTIAVRNETRSLTLNRQTPWSQESLQAQFYFTDQQKLDPDALRLAANEILNDPRQLAAFIEARDQNLGFQGAVMRARQRGGEVLGQSAPLTFGELYKAPTDGTTAADADPQKTTEIASARPAGAGSDDPEALETLLFARLNDGKIEVTTPEERAIDRPQLARQLQTELQRLGCYRMAIDGDWGAGSKRALREYLTGTKQPVGDLEPSVSVLNKALLQSGRICREPVIIKRQPAPAVARTEPTRRTVKRPDKPIIQSVQSFRRREVRGRSPQAQRERRVQRRQALPPDLSAGVGIGF